MAHLSVDHRVGLIEPPAAPEPAPASPSFDPRILSANLDALREVNPGLACVLEGLTVPSAVMPVMARDGSVTCTLPDSGGRPVFLGRTSMPRVRATALVDAFAPDGHNVLLPAIGAGCEMVELLSRTADHGAVVVHDPDPLNLYLALSLVHAAHWIQNRRLVLISGDNLIDELAVCLLANPGIEFPHRLLVPPHLDRRRFDALRNDLQELAARINHARTRLVQRHAARLADAATPRRDQPLVVLTVDPRSGTLEAAHALVAAAEHIHWTATACLPDRPDRCHAAARMQVLADQRAGAVLLLNCGWGPLLPHVPPHLPVATWLLPDARLLPGVTDGFSPRHILFAATPETEAQALACGAPPARVRRLELAVDATVFRPLGSDPQPAPTGSFPEPRSHNSPDAGYVACFADLHSLEPADCGLSLESHLRLWQSIIMIAARRPWTETDAILAGAERHCGVVLGEDHLRRQLDSLIRSRVLPTLRARGIAEHLLAGGFDVRVFGANWHQSRMPHDRAFSGIVDPRERNAVYNAARIVVCPRNDPPAVQTALEAAAAGACVARYSVPDDDQRNRPGLMDALQAMADWRDLSGLRAALQGLPADPTQRRIRAARARDIILQRHAWSHRLTDIRHALAELPAPE